MLFHILNPLVQAVNEVAFLFGSCDPIMQALCVLLLLASLVIWGVLFGKVFSLTLAFAGNRRFLQAFSRLKYNPAELKKQAAMSRSPAAVVYLAAETNMSPSRQAGEGSCGTARPRTFDEMITVRHAVKHAVEAQRVILRKRTLIVDTAYFGCLFLGLAGLVWGILFAFAAYARAGCADIRPLAAGIPGALLPLAIALLAAVPSYIGSRLVVSKLENVMMQLDFLAGEICADLASGDGGQHDCPEALSVITRCVGTAKTMFVQELLHHILKKLNPNGRD
jgi:biopolymer transport protein ExbB/TolQ